MRGLRTALPILLYHHVGPVRPHTHRSMTVEPERFRAHLDWLRRHDYRSLSIDQVEGWAEDQPLPRSGVLITFDDGYEDLAEFALPLLEGAGFSALVFVVTGLLGETNGWDADTGHGGHRLLSAEQIKEWSNRDIEFGAHTRTHPNLDEISLDDAREEIVGSKDDLEQLVQRPVRSFAYPFGVAGPQGRKVAADNFGLAFSDAEGRNAAGADRFWLRRTMVQPTDGGLDLASRLYLGRSIKQNARARLSRARTALRR
jgi:peptidoglycan/xylan/chitin deacetylase (PgdA/CDA1 family)